MDKTTTELRARLRDRYRYLRAAIGDPEPASGYFKWLQDRLGKERDEAIEEQDGAIVGDSMAGRGGGADQMALQILRAIASDEELGFLCQSLGVRRALARVPGDSRYNRDEWAVAWPDGQTFPHDLRQATTALDLVVLVLDAWIEHLDLADDPKVPATRTIHREPPPNLGRKARAVLELLYRDKAFDEAHACHLTKRAPTQLKYDSAKSPDTKDKYAKTGAAELKRLKLVDAVPRVGTWLTTEGRALAESLFGQKPR